jgi:hypothetical protein
MSSTALLIIIFALNLHSPILSYLAAAVALPMWLLYATEKKERSWFISILFLRSR